MIRATDSPDDCSHVPRHAGQLTGSKTCSDDLATWLRAGGLNRPCLLRRIPGRNRTARAASRGASETSSASMIGRMCPEFTTPPASVSVPAGVRVISLLRKEVMSSPTSNHREPGSGDGTAPAAGREVDHPKPVVRGGNSNLA